MLIDLDSRGHSSRIFFGVVRIFFVVGSSTFYFFSLGSLAQSDEPH